MGRVLTLLVAVALLGVEAGGQSRSAAPRTPWGDPDLQGTYASTYEASTPFERPDEFTGRRLED